MVHPFFERRRGREQVTYFDPCLEPILEAHPRHSALPGAAPAHRHDGGRLLRRRSRGAAARDGLQALGRAHGGDRSAAAQSAWRRAASPARSRTRSCSRSPRSPSTASPSRTPRRFALIAYASAYLKCYHPTAFLISLLNAWPMGFYHPASLVKDAQRHGVRVLPIDVNFSGWRCRWEEPADRQTRPWRTSDTRRAVVGPRRRRRLPDRPALHLGAAARDRRTHRGGAPGGAVPERRGAQAARRPARRRDGPALGSRGARLARPHPPRGALAGGARGAAEG